MLIQILKDRDESFECVFEHSRDEDTVVLTNDKALISLCLEELEAAIAYLRSIQKEHSKI